MRKLYNTSSTQLEPINKKFNITQEDWNGLLDTIGTLQADFNNHVIDFEQYKQALTESITTMFLTATTISAFDINAVTIKGNIESTDASIETAGIDNLTVYIQALIEKLNATDARITNVTIEHGDIQNLTGTSASFDTIQALQAIIDNYDITNLTSSDADITNLTASTIDAERANVDALIATDIVATDIQVNNIESNNLESVTADITNLEYEFAINDNDAYQDIVDADGIVYIQLPAFENGVYYVHGIDTSNNDRLFTVELFNSIENRFLRWSDSDAHYLVEAYNELPQFVLKVNTRGKSIRLYHRADTRATTQPPVILSEYIEPAVTDNTYYQIKYKDGNKVWKPFDLMGDGSAVGILTLDQTTDFDEVKDQDQTQYDTSSDVNRSYYIPNQDVNTTADVKHNNLQIGDTTEDVFTKHAEIDTEGNIEQDGYYRNNRLFVGARIHYDATELLDGGIVITEGLI